MELRGERAGKGGDGEGETKQEEKTVVVLWGVSGCIAVRVAGGTECRGPENGAAHSEEAGGLGSHRAPLPGVCTAEFDGNGGLFGHA